MTHKSLILLKLLLALTMLFLVSACGEGKATEKQPSEIPSEPTKTQQESTKTQESTKIQQGPESAAETLWAKLSTLDAKTNAADVVSTLKPVLDLDAAQKKEEIRKINQLQIQDAKYPVQMLLPGPINKETADIIETFAANLEDEKKIEFLNHKIDDVPLIKYLTDADSNGAIAAPGSRLNPNSAEYPALARLLTFFVLNKADFESILSKQQRMDAVFSAFLTTNDATQVFPIFFLGLKKDAAAFREVSFWMVKWSIAADG